MSAELDAKRHQLAELTAQLNAILAPGLAQTMQDPAWYLTGVKVGLNSLDALYGISELVYREYTANSEGGRRLANMRHVYERLNEFAGQGLSASGRGQLMLEMLQPLSLLLREFKGQAASHGATRERKTTLAQLAADIRLEVMRLAAFEKMEAELSEFLAFKYRFLKQARYQRIVKFQREYLAFSGIFGFEDANVLYDNKIVQEICERVRQQRVALEKRTQLLRDKLYRERHAHEKSNDLKSDLAEKRVMPILQEVSRAGFDYLNRAHEAYFHATQHVGTDMTLFDQVSTLGAEIADAEL